MTLLQTALKEARLARDVVELQRDTLGAGVITGKITFVNDTIIQIERLTDGGHYDGVTVIRTDDITRLRRGTSELKFIGSLSENNHQHRVVSLSEAQTLWSCVQSMQTLFSYVCLGIEDLDPDILIIGQLDGHDSNYVKLAEFGRFNSGETNELILAKDEITMVEADTPYCRGLLEKMQPRQP
ncbi:hypothetical protein [Coralliovum pocilloporae]|uniref:hypothetical protein n=1 Tax=Coralliovum pocilloporae TaxID=3066369 RepID=UPI003306A7C8